MNKRKLLMLLVLLGVIVAFSGILQAGADPLKDLFSVNFYMYPWPWTTDIQKETITLEPGQSAGFDTWLTDAWSNYNVPWAPPGPQPPVTLTSSQGSEATLNFTDCRNGGAFYWDAPRTTLLGDGNGDMMDGHINSTEDGDNIFEMTISDIPLETYDVIIYMGSNDAQFGDGTGKISFNGGPDQDFTILRGFDGTFTEIVDAITPGNYIVYKGVTGTSFTVRAWGNRANHIGPYGIQFGVLEVMKPSPANGDTVIAENPLTLSWTNLAPVDANDSTYVDVWFGTDPNEASATYDMVKIVDAGVDVISAAVDASAEGTYYWQVNSYLNGDPATTVYNNNDPNDPNVIEGNLWSFTVLSDTPPTVEMITPNQITWSGGPVPLVANITNEGASATIIEWVADPADGVVITDGDTATPTVTITRTPSYTAKIPSAGFEEPVVPDNTYDTVIPTGWTVTGYAGIADAAPGGIIDFVDEGEQCVWANPDASFSTVLSEKVQAGATYTLSVGIGYGQWSTGAKYLVQLIALDGEDEVVLAEDDNSNPPAALQTWSTSIVSYTNDPVADANKVDLPLMIKLVNPADSAGGADVEFDNVVLTSDTLFPVPSGVDTITLTVFVSDAANPVPVEASVEIDVYEDACAMARLAEGKDDLNDLDKDCDVDIEDLALQAATWLNDTSIDAPAASLDQAELPIVPNGDFQTIYEPGNPANAASIADGDYFSIGNQAMHAGAKATYADGSTGSGIELPGWVLAEGSKTNADVMQGGGWGGPDGSGDMAFLCFASWGGPTYIESAASLSLPVSGIGGEYKLSADVYNNGGPVVLELLVDGVAMTPDTASDPALIAADWVELTRTFNSIPAGDVKVLVGTRDDAGTGWTGNRASIDNVALTLESADANMPTVDAGENMITWSDQAVTLNPTVTNNDAEPQRELSYLWTAYPVDGVVFSDPVNPEDPNTSAAMAPTVMITKAAGDMASVKLTLSVTLDGQGFVNDFITIDVYDTACLAGVAANPETGFDLGDRNQDCITNLEDVAELATAWLIDYSSTGPINQPE